MDNASTESSQLNSVGKIRRGAEEERLSKQFIRLPVAVRLLYFLNYVTDNYSSRKEKLIFFTTLIYNVV